MGEEYTDVIMKRVRKGVLLNSLKKGKRYDGRAVDELRPVEIEKGVISTAEGSAVARIGKTQVLVGVKFDVATPFPDRPKEGVMMMNSELLPLASPTFESGPPREDAIELARVVDRGIRSAEIIDLDSFYIEEDKVLGLFLDIYVLDHDGNYLDTSALAATAALTDTKMPKIEEGKIVRGEYTGKLDLKALPVATTFVKIGESWLLDPSRDEELAMDSRITISTTEGHVCTMQKGKGFITRKDLLDNVEVAFKKGNELRNILKGD